MRAGCGYLRNSFPFTGVFLCLLVCALLGLAVQAAVPASAYADSRGRIVESNPLAASYVAQGYEVSGPLVVERASSQLLITQGGPGGSFPTNLTGKTVRIFDEVGNQRGFDALVPSINIYLLMKENDVVIIMLPKEDRSNV
jgi:hypothetical protein